MKKMRETPGPVENEKPKVVATSGNLADAYQGRYVCVMASHNERIPLGIGISGDDGEITAWTPLDLETAAIIIEELTKAYNDAVLRLKGSSFLAV